MKPLSVFGCMGALAAVISSIGPVADAAMVAPPNADRVPQLAGWSGTVEVSSLDSSVGGSNVIFLQTATPAKNLGPVEDAQTTRETSEILAFSGGSGTIQANLSTLVGETFHIEYEYSPVPETSTCGLIVGVACLAALASRLRP